MSPYPARPSLYSLHYIRWLVDSGTVLDIGPSAFALLVAVVTMEDELRYSRPPNFYNEQLARRCGIVSAHALIRARTKCEEAGLLEYESGGNRRPGLYFVCGSTAQNAPEPQPNTHEPLRIAHPNRNRTAIEPQPSTPLPIPKEEEGAATAAVSSSSKRRKPKPPKFAPEAIPLPESLDTPAVRDAWTAWCKDRAARRKPITEAAAKLQAKRLATWGPTKAVQAIENAISAGWTGLFEPEHSAASGPASPSAADRRAPTLDELAAMECTPRRKAGPR